MAEKCLIIGLGKIGLSYDIMLNKKDFVLSHSRAFSLNKEFELVGGVDSSKERQELFFKTYNKPAFSCIRLAMEVVRPTLIVIATPTNNHLKSIIEISNYKGIKVIMCEKPLEYSFEAAKSIVKVCKSNGIKLFVNYIRRADPGVIKIKEFVDKNIIKEPIKGVVWYSKGLLNNGSHFFNLLEFWLGNCKSGSVLANQVSYLKDDIEPDLEVVYEKGKIIFLAAWEEAFSHYSIELICSTGRLRYDNGGEEITWQASKKNEIFSDYVFLNPDQILIDNDMNRYQLNVVNQLAKELKGIKTTLCTGDQALRTLSSIENIINLEKYD